MRYIEIDHPRSPKFLPSIKGPSTRDKVRFSNLIPPYKFANLQSSRLYKQFPTSPQLVLLILETARVFYLYYHIGTIVLMLLQTSLCTWIHLHPQINTNKTL